VIAADGIHSRVREIWKGEERTNYTGRVAYRTIFLLPILIPGTFPGSALR
jgi:hypothetical protein